MYFLSFDHIFKTIVYKTFDFLSIESLFDHRPVVRRIGTYPFQWEESSVIRRPSPLLEFSASGMFCKSRFFSKNALSLENFFVFPLYSFLYIKFCQIPCFLLLYML